MGTIGSKKEDLGRFVAIYGFCHNEFAWKNIINKNVYHTTGLIIHHKSKTYVVTTRTGIISCKHIVMYHSYFKTNEPVMKNDLEILFQFIEQNIVILGTKKYHELDLSQSEIINGNFEPENVCIHHNMLDTIYPIPTRKSHYYAVRMDMNLDSDKISYCAHIENVKYLCSTIYDNSYLPESYLYKFILKENKTMDICGINGSIVFNKKRQLMGIITKSINDIFYVLPKKSLCKIFNDFLEYFGSPLEYHGLLSLPFKYSIINNELITVENATITTINGNAKLKKNDKIISIDGNKITVNTDQFATIFDKDYNANVPLNVYLKYNLNKVDTKNLAILRGGKIINFSIYGSICINSDLPFTNQPFYFPDTLIPYAKIGPLVIVQLTHELLDITTYYKIFLKNKIIDMYLENPINIPKKKNILLIIDCIDDVIAKKFSLPQFKISNNTQQLYCPLIIAVNNTRVSTLSDITNYMGNVIIDNITLTIGLSYKNQRKINL